MGQGERLLLTWSDRGAGRAPGHHGARPATDRGPILRLLESDEAHYGRILVLTSPEGVAGAEELLAELRERVDEAELRVLPVRDPSDHEQLFGALRPLVAGLPGGPIDVLLSAGTPQAQTTWVLLVRGGLLDARMLQVVPAAFVPSVHPRAVREVRLDFAGFPEIRALRAELGQLRAAARGDGLVGESAAMGALRARIARVARAEVPVLIQGETGTGKELVARALADGSDRARAPFIAESCGALSEGVLMSELFGHERGAFTGATGRREGLFELANGGVLFLDEVGEMPPALQVALLRVLQDGQLRRVGGRERVPVDVRVIAATHRDLRAMVRAGTFREDLYYRLCGAVLEVPPLRERAGDLEILVEHFLGPSPLRVSPDAWARLRAWSWPGNVRELRAEVLRWTVFCDGEVRPSDLSPELRGLAPRPAAALETLRAATERAEGEAIAAALAATGGNLSATSRTLGIDRNTLKRKLEALGLKPAPVRPNIGPG